MQVFLDIAKFFIRCYGNLAKNRVDRRLRRFINALTEYFPFHIRVLLLPKGQVRTRKPFSKCSNTAVVVQGPLVQKDDFTFEVVRSYLALFPDAQIIVSTWEDEDGRAISRIRSLGVHVVCSQRPESGGSANINYQLTSTLAGISKADALGAEYVLKTRTDCRIYASNVIGYLQGLIKLFPLQDSTKLKGRLIALDYSTRLYVPGHVADILMFGYVADMLCYWSAPASHLPEKKRGQHVSLADIWKESTPEVYLGKTFARRHLELDEIDSIERWWGYLRDYFIVVDRAGLGFFWSKYALTNESAIEGDLDSRAMATVSHRDWVCMLTSSICTEKLPKNLENLCTKKSGDFVEYME